LVIVSYNLNNGCRHNKPRPAPNCRVLPPGEFNTLQCKVNYSATSNIMQLVNWPLVGGLLHLVQRDGVAARPGTSLYQMYSPPINGQFKNYRIDVY